MSLKQFFRVEEQDGFTQTFKSDFSKSWENFEGKLSREKEEILISIFLTGKN